MEFWSTAVAFDPFPSTDEPEKYPLKKFLIKFSVLNGQRPLTLDFNTFCSSTGLNFNNDKYVDHPTPKVVKKELGKIATNPSYLDKTPVLKNSFLVGWRILFTFVIQGPKALGALFKKRKKPQSKRPPIVTMESPPKLTEGSKQSHSVSSGIVLDPQDLERDIQLASIGFPSILDEGTHQSKPLPDGTATHPKNLGGNKQPLNRDITSMTSNESMAKTTPCPEGSLGDKDSGETYHPLIWNQYTLQFVDPLGTGAKYQTFADIQAYLLSEDELEKESDAEEVLAAGDDMNEDIQGDEEVQTPSPKQDQPESSQYLRKVSRVLFNRIVEKQWEHHKEAAVSYADLKASIDQYYDENLAYRDQIDKLVEASMSSLDRSSTSISDLYKGLDAHALKQEEVFAAWTKSSTNLAWNLGSRMTVVEISQTALKHEVSSLRQDTSDIKSMMAEIYQAFKGQPTSGGDTPTLALTHIPTNVEGENATNTATEEPPSHTKGDTRDTTMAIPISLIQPTLA
ncbi:hypothetical protein Tco_1054571 [Tanacetum coccineum]|uniref:Uncharacterized protein n=1 Tax=Tanacetum coccineum TaxID=301880 RepID=A0ABQ5GXJ9_9ASTR